MQTELNISELKPLGTHVLLKKSPDAEKLGAFVVPEQYRINKDGHAFEGTMIAAGETSKCAKLGHRAGFPEPGDRVLFWHMWNWADKEVVLKDAKGFGEYLVIDESDILASYAEA